MHRLYVLLAICSAPALAQGLIKPSLFIQLRLDTGGLLYDKTFKDRVDLYIRRFEVGFECKPRREISLSFKAAADRWFQNYKGFKKETFPKRVVIKKAQITLKVSPNFSVFLGRGKKPFTRTGLNPSSDTLLVDKPLLFLKLKEWLGDYYATRIGVRSDLFKNHLRITLATAYSYGFRNYNDLKGYSVSTRQNLLNNIFLNAAIYPLRGWKEGKISNAAEGGKTLSLNLSYGYLGKASVSDGAQRARLTTRTEGAEFFFRKPLRNGISVTLTGGYLKGNYRSSLFQTRSLEGFYLRGGVLFGKPPLKVQPTFGVENIEDHPGLKVEKIYTLGVNLFPKKRVKLALNLSKERFKNIYGGGHTWLGEFQLQLVF